MSGSRRRGAAWRRPGPAGAASLRASPATISRMRSTCRTCFFTWAAGTLPGRKPLRFMRGRIFLDLGFESLALPGPAPGDGDAIDAAQSLAGLLDDLHGHDRSSVGSRSRRAVKMDAPPRGLSPGRRKPMLLRERRAPVKGSGRSRWNGLVRMKGVEPSRLAALEPKSSASTVPPHPQGDAPLSATRVTRKVVCGRSTHRARRQVKFWRPVFLIGPRAAIDRRTTRPRPLFCNAWPMYCAFRRRGHVRPGSGRQERGLQ